MDQCGAVPVLTVVDYHDRAWQCLDVLALDSSDQVGDHAPRNRDVSERAVIGRRPVEADEGAEA